MLEGENYIYQSVRHKRDLRKSQRIASPEPRSGTGPPSFRLVRLRGALRDRIPILQAAFRAQQRPRLYVCPLSGTSNTPSRIPPMFPADALRARYLSGEFCAPFGFRTRVIGRSGMRKLTNFSFVRESVLCSKIPAFNPAHNQGGKMSSVELRIRELLLEEVDALAGQDPRTMKLDLESTFQDWGINSLAGVAFLKRINKEFNVEISAAEARKITNLKELITYLEAHVE